MCARAFGFEAALMHFARGMHYGTRPPRADVDVSKYWLNAFYKASPIFDERARAQCICCWNDVLLMPLHIILGAQLQQKKNLPFFINSLTWGAPWFVERVFFRVPSFLWK